MGPSKIPPLVSHPAVWPKTIGHSTAIAGSVIRIIAIIRIVCDVGIKRTVCICGIERVIWVSGVVRIVGIKPAVSASRGVRPI